MSRSAFHVRHQATPERCLDFLQRLSRGLPTDGIRTPEEQATRLRALDLIVGKGKGTNLTPVGARIVEVGDQDPALAYELLYWLHYAHWDPASSYRWEFAWTWSFRTICDWFAARDRVPVPAKGRGAAAHSDGAHVRQMLAVDVAEAARREALLDDAEPDSQAFVSFSADSVEGVLVWLRALAQEPVIVEETFRPRRACPPALVVLACDSAARHVANQSGMALLTLSDALREHVARTCLLDPQVLDQLLDYTAKVYPHFLQTRSSNYGQQIVMPRLGLSIVDVV